MSTSPRTIVFVVPSMRRGGAERQTLTLARHLVQDEYRPLLITLDSEGPFFEAALASGIESVCLGVEGKVPVGALVRLIRILRDEQAQIVIASGFSATTMGRIAGIVARVPVIICAEHQTGDLGWGLVRRTLDRVLAHSTDAFVAVCNSQLKYLREEKHLPPDRTVVIYNGIEMLRGSGATRSSAREKLGLGSDEFVVGIVAAMRPEKDHATFLRAARGLRDRIADARFVVVGDGPTRARVESLAADLGLTGAVVFTGDREDVLDLLPAFDAFTLSSYTVEAFPMSALEAMACGVPVVATRVGGLPEMIREGIDGMLVSPRNPVELADAWLALTDPAMREAMSRQVRLRVEAEFTADRMTAEHMRLFERLLSRKSVSESGNWSDESGVPVGGRDA
jgi:glycosyltransferase involved in cell wall biosynthesis